MLIPGCGWPVRYSARKRKLKATVSESKASVTRGKLGPNLKTPL